MREIGCSRKTSRPVATTVVMEPTKPYTSDGFNPCSSTFSSTSDNVAFSFERLTVLLGLLAVGSPISPGDSENLGQSNKKKKKKRFFSGKRDEGGTKYQPQRFWAEISMRGLLCGQGNVSESRLHQYSYTSSAAGLGGGGRRRRLMGGRMWIGKSRGNIW